MSNLKRILSFLLVTAMLFTCVTVFAVEEAEETAKTYSFDLSITDSVSENHFRYDAISKKDGRLVGAETTARGTWTDTWLGYWPIGATGKSDYVFYDTEDQYYGSIIDMSCGGDYKAAVVFTAPEDGVYDIYVKGIKYQSQTDAIIDVALMRNGYSQPLATALDVVGANGAGEVVFDVKDVKLSAGDEIMLVTTLSKLNTRQGCDNFGIIKFDVTKTGTEGGYTYGNPTYEFGCDLTTKTCGNFYLAGRDSEGNIDRLKMELGTAWGEWKGWYLFPDKSPYVFCETQVSNPKLNNSAHGFTNGEHAYIDMFPTADYDSVVVFTAPVSGTYSFDALFSKLTIMAGRPAGYKVEAIKGEEVLVSHTFLTQTPAEKHEDANLTGSDVYLKTGETIMFVASHVSDASYDNEIAIRSIEVTLVEASCEHEWVNCVCKNCYSYCVHEWNNGVCITCGAACIHEWNNGVCDYCEVPCYHDWSYANGESTCAICGRVTDKVYVEYVSNLRTDNTVDGNFFLAALRNDGVVCEVEADPRGTWNGSYPGNWVAGATTPDAYITQKTECTFNSDVKFDMYPTADETYAAALVFEAPSDGTFNVRAKLQVIYGAKVKIVLFKNGTELLTKKATEWRELIDITYGNIELNKGDQLIIAVYKGDAGDALNTGYVSFNVGGLFETCPHVWNAETGTCSVCGAGCPDHNEKTATGACAVCGKGHTHTVTAEDATCEAAAICGTCQYEVAPKNPENHIGDMSIVKGGNGDGTHDWICNGEGCGAIVGPNEPCSYDENNICWKCEYDGTFDILTEKTDTIIDDFFANDGVLTGDYEVVGPADGDLDANKVTKPADDFGVEYAHFNLRIENETIILRHHFVVYSEIGEAIVTADGNEVTLVYDEDNSIYFIETVHEIGKLHEATTLTVEVGPSNVEYDVSVYSYLAIALEQGDDSVKTFAKALYDLNEAAR